MLGTAGERRAWEWYEAHGYELLDRNWRCAGGELDLVVRHEDTLVICEVKARTGAAFGHPLEAVTPAKQARLRRLAAAWLRAHGGSLARRPAAVRFDVIALLGDALEVVEGAF